MHRHLPNQSLNLCSSLPPFIYLFFTHNTLCLGTVQHNEIKIEFFPPLPYRLDKSPFCGGKGEETGAGLWGDLPPLQ